MANNRRISSLIASWANDDSCGARLHGFKDFENGFCTGVEQTLRFRTEDFPVAGVEQVLRFRTKIAGRRGGAEPALSD